MGRIAGDSLEQIILDRFVEAMLSIEKLHKFGEEICFNEIDIPGYIGHFRWRANSEQREKIIPLLCSELKSVRTENLFDFIRVFLKLIFKSDEPYPVKELDSLQTYALQVLAEDSRWKSNTDGCYLRAFKLPDSQKQLKKYLKSNAQQLNLPQGRSGLAKRLIDRFFG